MFLFFALHKKWNFEWLRDLTYAYTKNKGLTKNSPQKLTKFVNWIYNYLYSWFLVTYKEHTFFYVAVKLAQYSVSFVHMIKLKKKVYITFGLKGRCSCVWIITTCQLSIANSTNAFHLLLVTPWVFFFLLYIY